MHDWIILPMLLLVAMATWLLLRLRQQQRLIDTLLQDHAQLTAAFSRLPADAAALLPRGGAPLISVEILNPIELAARESRFAGPLGAVVPGGIRRRVYERTAQILQDELLKSGVQSEVRTHGLA